MTIELDAEERALLAQGLRQWSGPATPTEPIAVLVGFADHQTMAAEASRIAADVEGLHPLSADDWQRALTATEIAFASDRYGAGVDWETCTGLSDADTVVVLRRLQQKLIRAR